MTVVWDAGEPYRDTYYGDAWTAARGWDLTGPSAEPERFTATGVWGGTTPY